jgi:hypothetical protein
MHKKSAGGVAQGVGPEFKPQYHKKTKQNKTTQLASTSGPFRVLFPLPGMFSPAPTILGLPLFSLESLISDLPYFQVPSPPRNFLFPPY